MRILLIARNYPPTPCGIGDYTHRLAVELQGRGHELLVLTSKASGPAPTPERKGIQLLRWADTWDRAELGHLLAKVDALRPDVVHLQYHGSGFQDPSVTLLPRWIRVRGRGRPPVAVTLHEMTGGLRLLPLLVFSQAIVVTDLHYLRALSRIPFLRGKLRRIPLASAFDPDLARAADRDRLRRQMGLEDGGLLLVRFGFIHNIRLSLFPQLLSALRRLLDRGCPVKLLLVGHSEPQAASEVLSIARRWNLENRLCFAEGRSPSDVSAHLLAADIAVQLYPDGASEKRSSLHAVLQHGLPTVSTAGRGNVSSPWLEDRRNILLARSARPADLASAVAGLISDPALRAHLAEGARTSAGLFSWDKIALDTENLYQSLLRESARG